MRNLWDCPGFCSGFGRAIVEKQGKRVRKIRIWLNISPRIDREAGEKLGRQISQDKEEHERRGIAVSIDWVFEGL